MTDVELEQLRAFLRDHVSSFEELEVLLFLARTARRSWSVVNVAAAVNLSEELVRSALEALAAAELLERVPQSDQQLAFRYAPSEEHQSLLIKLQSAYAEQRLDIVQIMSSNAVERMRSSAARRLADAFRLGRNKK